LDKLDDVLALSLELVEDCRAGRIDAEDEGARSFPFPLPPSAFSSSIFFSLSFSSDGSTRAYSSRAASSVIRSVMKLSSSLLAARNSNGSSGSSSSPVGASNEFSKLVDSSKVSPSSLIGSLDPWPKGKPVPPLVSAPKLPSETLELLLARPTSPPLYERGRSGTPGLVGEGAKDAEESRRREDARARMSEGRGFEEVDEGTRKEEEGLSGGW
jgi:hypothetical protein